MKFGHFLAAAKLQPLHLTSTRTHNTMASAQESKSAQKRKTVAEPDRPVKKAKTYYKEYKETYSRGAKKGTKHDGKPNGKFGGKAAGQEKKETGPKVLEGGLYIPTTAPPPDLGQPCALRGLRR